MIVARRGAGSVVMPKRIRLHGGGRQESASQGGYIIDSAADGPRGCRTSSQGEGWRDAC